MSRQRNAVRDELSPRPGVPQRAGDPRQPARVGAPDRPDHGLPGPAEPDRRRRGRRAAQRRRRGDLPGLLGRRTTTTSCAAAAARPSRSRARRWRPGPSGSPASTASSTWRTPWRSSAPAASAPPADRDADLRLCPAGRTDIASRRTAPPPRGFRLARPSGSRPAARSRHCRRHRSAHGPPAQAEDLVRPTAGRAPRRLGAGPGEHAAGVPEGVRDRRTADRAGRPVHPQRRARPDARPHRRPHHRRHRGGGVAVAGADQGAGRRLVVLPRRSGAPGCRRCTRR